LAAIAYNNYINLRVPATIRAGRERPTMPPITQHVAGSPIRLQRPFDFGFLSQYGDVFCVVANGPDSGNLCFGVRRGGRRYFVKFAGAPKEGCAPSAPRQAVEWLREAKQVYRDLSHPGLVRLVKSGEAGGGYANVFEWTDAQCIGQASPASRQRFLALPAPDKMRAYRAILDFHAHVADRSYVSIDFYADQILYDFRDGQTLICDVDFYRPSPYHGDLAVYGSSHFVSPEERVPGQRVDEITMVYTMGATAFCLFADYDRSPARWPLGGRSFQTLQRAVNGDRDGRQRTVRQFIGEWEQSLAEADGAAAAEREGGEDAGGIGGWMDGLEEDNGARLSGLLAGCGVPASPGNLHLGKILLRRLFALENSLALDTGRRGGHPWDRVETAVEELAAANPASRPPLERYMAGLRVRLGGPGAAGGR